MGISDTVDFALTLTEVDFHVLRHRTSNTSLETARRAGVDGDKLAKAVALLDDVGPLLVVIPASRSVDVHRLRGVLHRPGLRLMTEQELDDVFYDCDRGAVPPLGPEYRVPTVLDHRLTEQADVYFEAGDHVELVHVSATSFQKLMRGAETLDCSIAALHPD
jgi:Ala-tRNA(Pro) deacylase